MAKFLNPNEALRDAIRRDGRSLNRIAQAAEIDVGQLSRFMRGTRGLTLDTVIQVCGALGVEIRFVRRRDKKA